MDTITATYTVHCAAADAPLLAKNIAYEQTVEVPEKLITDEWIRETIVGKVRDVAKDAHGKGAHRVVIEYDAMLANGQLPQLLNLLFGNISILGNIRLVDVALPQALLEVFNGPRYGEEGLRALLGVYGRPLLATAIKPRGLDNAGLAKVAGDFVRGGGDIVKDDHNLSDDSYELFRERAQLCHEAARRANDETGRHGQYFPSLMAPAHEIERYVECCVRVGIRGVLISPMLCGLDLTRHLSETYPLVFMGHPTFGGSYYGNRTQGVTPELLCGLFKRLAGCDISIFPNYGGRFGLTREECMGIHAALQAPLAHLKTAFPAPAGGMDLSKLPSMIDTYGERAIFLIGGALLSQDPDLAKGTRIYVDAIRERFGEELREPQADFASACELPSVKAGGLKHHIAFNADYSWQGRPETAYKGDESLPFKGVKRVELIGKTGERGAFDLRYFELEPGGYTSFERHHHTHTVIGVRGEGVVLRAGERHPLKVNDIAYIAPMEPHQLRNENTEPFGFYCLVDRERDRPQAAE